MGVRDSARGIGRGLSARVSVATLVACALALCAVLVRATEPVPTVRYDLDIPRQPLDSALRTFAEQTGLQVARFDDPRERDVTVGPLSGRYTLDQALSILLRSSGFSYLVVNNRTI